MVFYHLLYTGFREDIFHALGNHACVKASLDVFRCRAGNLLISHISSHIVIRDIHNRTSIILDDVGDYPILKCLGHILRVMIALVRSGFQHFNSQILLDFLCKLGQKSMVCRMVRHLEPGYQMALCIDGRLSIITNSEAVVLLHQFCIRICQ